MKQKKDIRKLLKRQEFSKIECSMFKIHIQGSWTANKGFTVEEGEKDISQFVSKWALDECWLYCIDYIECIETEFGKNHHYNVKFSIPTRQKPVPLATASVFFVLTESKSGSPKYVLIISVTLLTLTDFNLQFSNRSRVPSRGTPPEPVARKVGISSKVALRCFKI